MRKRFMRTAGLATLALLLVESSMASATAGAATPLVGTIASTADERLASYGRASRFLPKSFARLVRNGQVDHAWLPGTDRLLYRIRDADGAAFFVLDAKTGERTVGLDPRRLAALTGRSERELQTLIDSIELIAGNTGIDLALGDAKLVCSYPDLACRSSTTTGVDPAAISPGGRFELTRKSDDLWVKDRVSDREYPLTSDGTADFSYGRTPESSTAEISMRRAGTLPPPQALWSPDGRRFLTYRLDQSKVKDLHLLQLAPEDGSVRPVVHSYRYPFPGDAKPLASFHIFDAATGKRIAVDMDPTEMPLTAPFSSDSAWFSEDGTAIYLVTLDRGARRGRLIRIDAGTGQSRVLIEEEAGTTFLPNPALFNRPNVRVLQNGDIIWQSERDGWAHLYLYDGSTLRPKRQITSGAWVVRDIIDINESAGEIYFTASGREKSRDPYQRYLYRARLDGSGLKLLTPEDADHDIAPPPAATAARRRDGTEAPGRLAAGFAPGGAYFVDRYSRPDLPVRTVLRSREGRVVATLAKSDIGALEAGGFVKPEPFEAIAADGKTTIFGTIHRPADFDPAHRYPVIDWVYPGPQHIQTAKRFGETPWLRAQALAETGFIVVTVEGRGTPLRSKAMRDFSYGRLEVAGGLEDHVAAIRQLAARYPYFDLDRVGITGHSGGGFATARALFDYPDFYKVGVSSSGNHDQSGYISLWGEYYQGPFDPAVYARATSFANVDKFKGKILIVHGDMDDNVHLTHSMRLMRSMMQANKDFDFLLLPNANHSLHTSENGLYFVRRSWDYFVEHLRGETPPANYLLTDEGAAPTTAVPPLPSR